MATNTEPIAAPHSTIVFLVRHGQSVNNHSHVHGGGNANVLTALGRRQARETASKISAHKITVIYTSPQARAFETATIIGRRFGGIKPIVVPEFDEINIGVLDGLQFEAAERKYPRVYARTYKNSWYAPPGGESLRRVQARAVPVLLRLVRDCRGGKAIIVSHHTTNQVILATLLGIPLEKAWAFKQHNCAVNQLEFSDEGFRLALMNG